MAKVTYVFTHRVTLNKITIAANRLTLAKATQTLRKYGADPTMYNIEKEQ